MKVNERKKLVQIGKELKTLTQEDIDYILDLSHTDYQVECRMTAARKRVIDNDLNTPNRFVRPVMKQSTMPTLSLF